MANEDLFGISDEDKAAEKNRLRLAKARANSAKRRMLYPEIVARQIKESIRKKRERDPEAFKAKAAAKARIWRAQNPEKVKAGKQRDRVRYAEKIKEYSKSYYEKNRETQLTKVKEWNAANREHRKAWKQADRAKNPQKYRDRRAAWVAQNQERYRKWQRDWDENKRATDINFKLAKYLRIRITHIVRVHRIAKAGSFVAGLDCTIGEFADYIEAKFVSGMTWETWGNGEGRWHLDHIRPLASFDLSDPEQFAIAAHHTNYQPLWAIDNLKKGKQILSSKVRNSEQSFSE